MMMQALEAGGLEALFSGNDNALNRRFGDKNYKPNGGGFYELPDKIYQQSGFPRMFPGKLIKLLCGGITQIVAGDYRIVFMRRDPEEVRQSHEAFFSKPPPYIGECYTSLMEDKIGILRQRRDVQITVLWYRDVVNAPLEAFRRLKDSGWPIDPVAAAAIVNPNLCRYQLEQLEVGIR